MPLPPDKIEAVRADYAGGTAVHRIVGAHEITLAELYYCVGGCDDGDGPRLAPIPRRRIVLGRKSRQLKTSRLSLVSRLWRTAERQVRDIEGRLAVALQEPVERERDVRVLAVLVKTLRELSAFDAAAAAAAPTDVPQNDDRGPADIDEFRRELARRMEAIVARRKSGVPGEPDAAGG